MSDNRSVLATPNSSKLAQILLQLKEVEGDEHISTDNSLYFSSVEVVSFQVTDELKKANNFFHGRNLAMERLVLKKIVQISSFLKYAIAGSRSV